MTIIHPFIVHAAGIFSSVTNPTKINSSSGEGLFTFLGYIFKLLGVIAGIYMVVQLITAGYMYISASGDTKKTEQAWNQIWQSILGLVIVASAFVLASVIGRITGINIISPTIYGPQ